MTLNTAQGKRQVGVLVNPDTGIVKDIENANRCGTIINTFISTSLLSPNAMKFIAKASDTNSKHHESNLYTMKN